MSVFVKNGNEFIRQGDEIGGSINDIAIELGYHPDQVHTYFSTLKDVKINIVSFEIFTNNIAFVLCYSGVESLEEKEVNKYLMDFNVTEEYHSYKAEDILTTGIGNKSLRINYIARVLNIEEPNDNGLFFIERLGLNLFFIDGILTDFQTADGLSTWAKEWKELNPAMFNDYENVAKQFWGTNISMIIKEINKQADACAWIPEGFRNEFIPLHRTKYGTINFFMLKVCHYVKTIRLSEFLEINCGRYKEIKPKFGSSLINIKRYNLDNFAYEFTDEGVLLQYYSI